MRLTGIWRRHLALRLTAAPAAAAMLLLFVGYLGETLWPARWGPPLWTPPFALLYEDEKGLHLRAAWEPDDGSAIGRVSFWEFTRPLPNHLLPTRIHHERAFNVSLFDPQRGLSREQRDSLRAQFSTLVLIPGMAPTGSRVFLPNVSEHQTHWFFLSLNGAIYCTAVAFPILLVRALLRIQVMRRQAALARGVCSKCGYSIVGLTAPVCPECGTPFDPVRQNPDSAGNSPPPQP